MSLLLALAATAAVPQTSIDEISRFLRYKRDGERALYVQSSVGSWYRVEFQGGDCPRLSSANGIGFDAAPFNRLDNTSAVIADGVRCPIASVTRSAPPPRDLKR